MPLKILYEASVLGYAAQSASYRTGVFRMVDAWARGLAQCPDVDLVFGAFLDARTALRTHRYCSHFESLSNTPLLPQILGANALGALDDLQLRLSRNSKVPLPQKIIRRGLNEILSLWDRSQALGTDVRGFDVFHATFWPFPVAARNPNTRFAMTFVDLINLVNPNLSTDGGAFFKNVLSTVHKDDFTICISEATRRDLLSVRPDLDPNKSFVVHLAASEQFRPEADAAVLRARLNKWNLTPESYVLSVCTLERRKNIPMLIDAFEAWASRSGDKLQLVLTGASGNALDAIHKHLQTSSIRSRVRFLGFVPDEDLAPLYQGAAVFAYPSLHEGFGLPVLEALQCGAQVVTSDNSSLVEVGGSAAIYCDATSRESIVDALDRALKGADATERRRKAIEQARRFSWQISIHKLLSIYRLMADS